MGYDDWKNMRWEKKGRKKKNPSQKVLHLLTNLLNFLEANAKFIGGMQNNCEGTQNY